MKLDETFPPANVHSYYSISLFYLNISTSNIISHLPTLINLSHFGEHKQPKPNSRYEISLPLVQRNFQW